MHTLFYILAAVTAVFLVSLTPPGKSFRRRMMARMYTKVQQKHEACVAERKRQLLSCLTGTVLEIGPGTGVNFKYMPDTVERWIGIEPNQHMHAELEAAGARHDIETEFRILSIEGMAIEDGSVDAVLSTLVLCSVPEPEAVLRDILRILKPGGRFVFLEHVAAPQGTGLRRRQRWLRPIWSYLADGCCPDRELGAAIEGAGFCEVEIERFELPKVVASALISTHVAGSAVK
jgi:SAM-dependent methyltransferase